jgi:methylenetetrahydrofolate reductase (NADPH)
MRLKAGTNLEKVLGGGSFAVTAEIGPPRGANADVIQNKLDSLKGYCDAFNVTDNQTAIARMSSLSGCVLIRNAGHDPVMQIVCRDRNRIAIQSDVLGAVALVIVNILCLSGDHQRFGNHPEAKGVFDIDSIQLIQMLKTMRDENKFLSGDEISGDVPLYIGAAANPFADPVDFRVARLAKKVKAGADFIQTQAIYDVSRFTKWMEGVRRLQLDRKVHILAGIIPPKSIGMLRYMKDYVPGVFVPDGMVTRLENAEDAKQEGLSITIELIQSIRNSKGVKGIHIMAVNWETIVPEIFLMIRRPPRSTL